MTNVQGELYQKAARLLVAAKYPIALSGAGISVDSGIPDFRSPGGLWTHFDPMEYGTIEAFNRNPSKAWEMFEEMSKVILPAKPNPGHLGLAELEEMGLLKAIITQNIDNLHQEAGSKNVIEFHGNSNKLVCRTCGGRFSADEAEAKKNDNWPPECPSCAEILKPDVVLFGEQIPYYALTESQAHAQKSDLIFVLGASVTVMPASGIPLITRNNGGKIIEFNLTETQLSPIADITLFGNTSVTVPRFVQTVSSIIE